MAKEVERITVPQIDWDEFIEKAKAVYEQLKPQLLPNTRIGSSPLTPRRSITLWARRTEKPTVPFVSFIRAKCST